MCHGGLGGERYHDALAFPPQPQDAGTDLNVVVLCRSMQSQHADLPHNSAMKQIGRWSRSVPSRHRCNTSPAHRDWAVLSLHGVPHPEETHRHLSQWSSLPQEDQRRPGRVRRCQLWAPFGIVEPGVLAIGTFPRSSASEVPRGSHDVVTFLAE